MTTQGVIGFTYPPQPEQFWSLGNRIDQGTIQDWFGGRGAGKL